MSRSIHTGIKKDKDFLENLESVRKAINLYGFMNVYDRLEEMKKFFWVQCNQEESCTCIACNLQRAILYEANDPLNKNKNPNTIRDLEEWERIHAQPLNWVLLPDGSYDKEFSESW